MDGKPLNPFAPPEHEGAVPGDALPAEYRSQEVLVAGLRWALFALAALHALVVVLTFFAPTTASMVVVPVAAIVSLAIAIPFAMFLFRTNRNIRALGEYLSFTPAATIYWYFVPFLNLVRPYRAMAEMWDACASDSSHRRNILPVWWILFWLNRIMSRFAWAAEAPSESTLLVASVLACGLSICAMIIVQTLGDGQEALARSKR